MRKEHLTSQPSGGRIVIYDSLRSAMIFIVIILHVCMTYMMFPSPRWPFISKDQSYICNIIVNVIDIFVIPVLFFISGYFTPSSYLKKGLWIFLKEKFIHILLPWIIGTVFVLPLVPLFTGDSLSSILNLLKEDPSYFFFYPSHLWYLMVLFLFFFFYSLYAYFFRPVTKPDAAAAKKPFLLLITLIIISGLFTFLSEKYITTFSDWIKIAYVIKIQPAKITMHICMFILGIYAWRQNWFKEGGWMPDIRFWRISAITSIAFYMILKGYIPYHDSSWSIINAIFNNIGAFSALMYALLIALKLQNTRLSDFLVDAAPYSYGIYWIHLPLMFAFLSRIDAFDIPIWIKCILSVIVTSAASWLVCKYVLKKTPFLKNMF